MVVPTRKRCRTWPLPPNKFYIVIVMGNCLFLAMPYISSEGDEDEADAQERRSLFSDFQRIVGGIVVVSPDRRRIKEDQTNANGTDDKPEDKT